MTNGKREANGCQRPSTASPIPRGLCHPALGCEQRATVGVQRAALPTLRGLYRAAQPRVYGQASDTTLSGLMKAMNWLSQGSSLLATLG
jgi:hypothetical protein